MRIRFNFIMWLALVAFPFGGLADEGFDEYLKQVREQAMTEGVSALTIDQAFAGLTPDERVIGFDRRQPEFVQTFEEYLQARVSAFRISEGRRLLTEHRALLERVSAGYGVEPEYIVAFWGLETSFGRHQGNYSIIRSLATLGYDPRRSAFFTSELVRALHILDEGHVESADFVGAWAGAMGQCQFMPGSFLDFAQDFDGDGRKDIWQSKADVFASIAAYLQAAGWTAGRGWGAPISLPASIEPQSLVPETWDTSCRALKYHTRELSLTEWRDRGVVPTGNIAAGRYALLLPESGEQTSYLVGGNFRAILKYNCANKYAVSVGLLADLLAMDPVSPESS